MAHAKFGPLVFKQAVKEHKGAGGWDRNTFDALVEYLSA